jgi:hypothetical protein
MGKSIPYNGHRSWNAWNVSLWLNNDEGLYGLMQDAIKRHKPKARAARHLTRELEGRRTPDGGRYNFTTILAAMAD